VFAKVPMDASQNSASIGGPLDIYWVKNMRVRLKQLKKAESTFFSSPHSDAKADPFFSRTAEPICMIFFLLAWYWRPHTGTRHENRVHVTNFFSWHEITSFRVLKL